MVIAFVAIAVIGALIMIGRKMIEIEPEDEEVHWMVAEMESMRQQFARKTGHQPKGWAMGLDEYTKIHEAIKAKLTDEQKGKVGNLEYFNGLPVSIKCTKGIELLVDLDAATQYENIRNELKESREELI